MLKQKEINIKQLFLLILAFVAECLVKYFMVKSGLVVINNRIILGLIDFNFFVFIIIILFTIFFLVNNRKGFFSGNHLALGLILVGLASNSLDRFFYSGVIDYFIVRLGQISLNFNLADIYIVLGVMIYGFNIFEKKHN